jgi:DNA adenine methylase
MRYPGGKACLFRLTARLLQANQMERSSYIEPYAGGAGLALALLMNAHVHELHLNDVDPLIAAFWRAVLNQPAEFAELIRSEPVDVEAWRRHRAVCLDPIGRDDLELGFAAFFLNRTNRSGVIKGGGVIGGLNQSGAYKIDCRFNREDLAARVLRIAKYRSRIHLYQMDALPFLKMIDANTVPNALFCIDPPYFHKGSSLYTSFYRPDDHAAVANVVRKLNHAWMLTYDMAPEIRALYQGLPHYGFSVSYSVQQKRVATELLVLSPGLKPTPEIAACEIPLTLGRAAA